MNTHSNNLKCVGLLLLLLSVQQVSAYYDPGVQRWINRDPIGEGGEVNLFEFAMNRPSKVLDAFGLEGVDSPSASVEVAILRGDVAKLKEILSLSEEHGLNEAGKAAVRRAIARLEEEAAKKAAQQLEARCVEKVGKLAKEIGRKESEVKDAIHAVKRPGVGGGGKGIPRNPNVKVDPKTGEVYPVKPGGGLGDSIGNIFDHLPKCY